MALSNFDAEMSRFENEISNVNTSNAPLRMPMMPSGPPPPGMFPPMMPGLPPLPPPPPGVMAQLLNSNNSSAAPPPRLPPRPAFVPHQLRHRVPQQSVPFPSSSMRSAQMPPSMSQRIPSPPPPPPQLQGPMPAQQQSILSAQPLLYKNQTSNEKPSQPPESLVPTAQRPVQIPVVENKPSTSKIDKQLSVTKSEPNPHPVSKAYAAQAMETNDQDAEGSTTSKKKSKVKPPKKPRHVRMAGGTTWEDETLCEWDADDFRLFCGDLGNEVNDDILTRAFNKYPSFQKAKVVRDKRSGKTRGYGFISFKDSQDYIRAMREMNGKYVGNRPVKLRKSTWQERNIDVVRKKIKDKVKLGLR
ncbi:unnamed protein product [Rotaria magnacalcarata]|uniref:RNA-binding protein 42 n=1 Tax=Rotaria magnacalcarata TaxID=392030 RepID=A0A815ZLL2_9BILA|nr:unnamed protein product [Rotaria magnacalcarata]CAF4010318.1 unnamed protein product [Rotaria magnacalcarata]